MIDRLSSTPLDSGTPRFQPSSVEATVVTVPNSTSNVIPASARAVFSIRYNDLHTRPGIEAWVREKCEAVAAELDARCGELLQLVGLAGKAGGYPRDLTQVEMRKLELARAMAAEPKLLIADESMAGLSQSEVDDIVALLIALNQRGITIILIEHIMRAVMSFSQRLVVLVSGRMIADGNPEEVVRDPEVERAYLGQ